MEFGERLAAQGRQLRLLLAHLAGPAVRARVELDDLEQEVYLRALAAQDRAPPPDQPGDGALRRWLASIARNTVVDVARALRAAKRDARVGPLERSAWSRFGAGSGTGRPGTVPDPGPGPHTRAVGAESERALVAAFHSLAPEHRRVLGLRQFEGLSAAEAARRMGRSETAIHSLYRRALAAWEAALASVP